MVEVYVSLNNVTSPGRLTDTARVVYNFSSIEVKGFIVTKVSGMAAQVGVPEVSKWAYRLGKPFLILPELKDVIELIKPTKVYLVVKTSESKPLESMQLSEDDRVLLVVSGSDDGFTKKELGLGQQIYPEDFREPVGPAAEIAVTLHFLKERIRKS